METPEIALQAEASVIHLEQTSGQYIEKARFQSMWKRLVCLLILIGKYICHPCSPHR